MPTVATDPRRVAARPTLWRITDRRTFGRLRRHGRRARAGGTTVVWAPPLGGVEQPPRVAFSVGRRAGGAVTRNRIRRRLRAGLQALVRSDRLPAGDYLVTAGGEVATRPWSELVAALDEAVARATSAPGTAPRRR